MQHQPSTAALECWLRYIALAFVPLAAACSLDGQSLQPPPAASALSLQVADSGRFDPGQVEFVAKPKPASVGDALGISVGFVARIVNLRPLLVEILDQTARQFPNYHFCQMVRVSSVDARNRRILGRLRLNDVVKGQALYVEGGLGKRVVTHLKKMKGQPAYFHDLDKATCDNRSGTLLVYQTPSWGRLVVYNDLTTSYRDQNYHFFEQQKLGPGSLSLLMQSLAATNFNAYPSQKWTDDLATDSAITLVSARYQKVMFDGYETQFARISRAVDDIRDIALANVSYVLSYKEKREMTFLEWPVPEVPPDQVENLRKSSTLDDRRTNVFSRPVPRAFLDQLPVFYTTSAAANLHPYVKSGSRIFRIFRDGSVPAAHLGTLDEVRVGEVVPIDNAFAKSANPAVQPICASLAILGTMLWPSSTGVKLQQLPSAGLPVTAEEFAAHQPFYGRIFNACPRAGFDFIEGNYVYKNVRLIRIQHTSR